MTNTLIVDDSMPFREALKVMLLGRFPFLNVEGAADGNQALQKIKAHRPEIVFTDIRMPGINGIDLVRRIRETFPDTMVVILTSYDLPEYREAACLSGVQHFLTKGYVTSEEIAAVVESVFPVDPSQNLSVPS